MLEGHLQIEAGEQMEDFMLSARDEFISAMLRMHANSSRKWRMMMKNAKMEVSDQGPIC